MSDEIIRAAGGLAANGMDDQGIYDFLGISKQAFYTWLKDGEALAEAVEAGEARPPKKESRGKKLIDFVDAIKKGRSTLKARSLKKINEDQSWQSAAWILERRWPDEYGKREKLDMEVTAVKIVDDIGDDADAS